MEISPDLGERHVRRNYYAHDDMDEIETKIVTFDRKDQRRKEGVDKYLDEDGNGIKDIDEEAELVNLLIWISFDITCKHLFSKTLLQ